MDKKIEEIKNVGLKWFYFCVVIYKFKTEHQSIMLIFSTQYTFSHQTAL